MCFSSMQSRTWRRQLQCRHGEIKTILGLKYLRNCSGHFPSLITEKQLYDVSGSGIWSLLQVVRIQKVTKLVG